MSPLLVKLQEQLFSNRKPYPTDVAFTSSAGQASSPKAFESMLLNRRQSAARRSTGNAASSGYLRPNNRVSNGAVIVRCCRFR